MTIEHGEEWRNIMRTSKKLKKHKKEPIGAEK